MNVGALDGVQQGLEGRSQLDVDLVWHLAAACRRRLIFSLTSTRMASILAVRAERPRWRRTTLLQFPMPDIADGGCGSRRADRRNELCPPRPTPHDRRPSRPELRPSTGPDADRTADILAAVTVCAAGLLAACIPSRSAVGPTAP